MSVELLSIIDINKLLKIYRNNDVVIVDATSGKNAKSIYESKHLDGALFVDLNTELADIKEDVSAGGRHPLPDCKEFSKTLTKLGISKNSHVVVYDEKNGSNAAARFWWMLKAVGHSKIQVLDGGFQAAERNGFPINADIVKPKVTDAYKTDNWILPMADMSEVQSVSGHQNHTVIDVRSNERYNGETEPIDLIAGHIPGAVNIPFTTNLDETECFKSPDELKKIYQPLFVTIPSENMIVHCGSGVTACHTLLAMDYAGFNIPKLYVGSWSEWSRNNKPIATKANGL